MKLIIQQLWKHQPQWDQPVAQETRDEWQKLQNKLKAVEDITIQRWCHYEEKRMEIHAFCDASEQAFEAAVYSKVIAKDQSIVTLLQATSKVVPTKLKVTLPKLELCSAVLLVKLLAQVTKALRIDEVSVYA